MDTKRSSTGTVKLWALLTIFGFVFVTLTFISPSGASAASFQGLGNLDDSSFIFHRAYGVSANGSVVVGEGPLYLWASGVPLDLRGWYGRPPGRPARR